MVEWLLAAAAFAAPPHEVPCPRLGNEDTTTEVIAGRDVVLGPLVLLGARRMANRQQDAFRRKGYKVPITLLAGVEATLTVPPSGEAVTSALARCAGASGSSTGLGPGRRLEARRARGRHRAALHGVRRRGPQRLAGRPGRRSPRCVTLVVKVEGSAPVRRRVPLGRPC